MIHIGRNNQKRSNNRCFVGVILYILSLALLGLVVNDVKSLTLFMVPKVEATSYTPRRTKVTSTTGNIVHSSRFSKANNVQSSLSKPSSNILFQVRRGGGRGKISFRLRGKVKPCNVVEEGKASILSSVFNLINNVAGAGILTLSSGMASGTGYIPAMLICAILGALSGHCFSMVGEACEIMEEDDFKGLWKHTIGENTSYVVDAIIAIMCLACAIIYSGILGDVFTPLLTQIGFPDQYNGRTSNIIVITLSLLLPLSLIKDLSALAFTSVLGFAAIIYTVVFIIIRALDGSYALPDGKFLQDGLIRAMPAFEKTSIWNFDFTSLVLASNLGLAYIAHYNAPNFYRSLKQTNSKRFRIMVYIAFSLLVALYIATMTAGYSTFGDVCKGNILLNYHPDDLLSTLGRLATGLSILFGFPLVACGAREAIIGVASSLGNESLGSSKNHLLLVTGLLTFVTAISCTVEDVSLVVGLTGAALGSFIVYICPPLIFSKAVTLVKGAGSLESKKAQLNLALVPFGLFIAFLGCYMTIKSSLSKK